MSARITLRIMLAVLVLCAGCTTYKAGPVPFKSPEALPNATRVAGAIVAARAFAEPDEAKEAFGFDIRGAGMLPVQVVFDHQGDHPLEINIAQTFLEDRQGNLWPLLDRDTAYDRASNYAETRKTFKEGAYHGFLGAAAGAVIGAAVGIVGGENVAETAGKGAAVGAAAGAVLGGAKGYGSGEARHTVIHDLNKKTLENRAIEPMNLTYGFLFFPGEAGSARQLRLQLREMDTGVVYLVQLNF